MSRRARIVLVLFLTFVGLGAAAWNLPLVSDREWDDMSEALSILRSEASAIRCERTAIGDGEALDQAAFERWFEVEMATRHGCLDVSREVSESFLVHGRKGSSEHESWNWDFDGGAPGSSRVIAEGDRHRALTHPPVPLPHRSANAGIEERCDHLEAFLARVAASSRLCAPNGVQREPTPRILPPGVYDASWPAHVLANASLPLANATIMVARRAWREGDTLRAATIFERGLIAVRDMRRGPVSMMQASISLGAESRILGHYQSLLAGPIEWSDAELRARLETLQHLRNDAPNPAHYVRFDVLGTEASEWTGAQEGNMSQRLGFFAVLATPHICADAPSGASCWASLAPPPAPAFTLSELPDWAFEFRFTRRWATDALVHSTLNAEATYLAHVVGADRDLAAFADLLRLAHGRNGTCPPSIELEPIPHSEGTTRVVHEAGAVYEVFPPHLTPGPAPRQRTVFTLVCPPASASWGAHAREPIYRWPGYEPP